MLDPNSQSIVISVVTPQTGDPSTSGRVRNLPVSPQAIPAWLELRPANENRPAYFGLKGKYADKGYAMLRDLYEAEGNREGWDKYQRYIAAWKAGTARVSFPFADLPAEVQRRQSIQLVDNEFGGEFSAIKATTGEAHPLPKKSGASRSSS